MKVAYLLHEGGLGSPCSALCLFNCGYMHCVSLRGLGFSRSFSVKVDSNPVVPLCGRFSPQLQLIDKVVTPSLMSCGLDFLGPCTKVQGWGSCPQGHGLHN